MKDIYNEICDLLNTDKIYLVGGCVRDYILGLEPKDFDFTTPLYPDHVESLIKEAGRKAYTVGKRFGTIGFRNKGMFFEVTTFRNEKYVSGSRKPEVKFVKDITADLSRRDFTINAMAYRDKKIIDPFGGKIDIENKIVRAVGNPRTRIKEDPLRILRTARFACRLGFSVDDSLYKACNKFSYKLMNISIERCVDEIDKILLSEKPSIGLDLLMEWGVFKYMIPEISLQKYYDQNSKYHDLDLWKHTRSVVDATPAEICIRWAALLHDIAKPFVRSDKNGNSNYIMHERVGADMVERVGRFLKWSNARRDWVKDIVLNHLKEDSQLRKYDNMFKKEVCSL